MMQPKKTCTGCGISKAMSSFYKNGERHRSRCKQCMQAAQAMHREPIASESQIKRAKTIREREEIPCESWRYIKIIQILGSGHPRSAEYLAEKTESQMTNMRLILRGMRFSRLICIKEWRQENRAWAPYYGLGAIDCETPEAARHLGTDKLKPRARIIAFADLVNRLRLPIMAKDLAENCGLSQGYVHRFIKVAKMHDLIRICGWTREAGSGNWTPVWKLRTGASKKDAPRPKPITAKEKQRRHIAAQAHKRKAERLVKYFGAIGKDSSHA